MSPNLSIVEAEVHKQNVLESRDSRQPSLRPPVKEAQAELLVALARACQERRVRAHEVFGTECSGLRGPTKRRSLFWCQLTVSKTDLVKL